MVTSLAESPLPLADIQGLILRSYNMAAVRHFILRIDRADGAKNFIGKLVNGDDQICPQITAATQWQEKPSYCVNIGFTYSGLTALQLRSGFSFNSDYFQSFIDGAAARSKALGNLGASAPEHWQGRLGTDEAHILLSVHARDRDVLTSISEQLRTLFSQDAAIQELACFDGDRLADDKVHFGFKDGIAQPVIEGVPTDRPIPPKDSIIPAYRFVLLDDPNRQPYYQIPTPHQLGLNGSFAAFQVLEQDVAGFDRFLHQQAATIPPELLAAKMCGRWRNGVPLALSPDTDNPIDEDRLNDFDYADDRQGFRCPIGSHVRRTNPRKSKIQGNVDIHRMVRRGMPYGPPYDPNSPDDGIARGLLGMFIGTSLNLQFEFVMTEWVNKGEFSGFLAPNSKDPLMGNNTPDSSEFEIPIAGQETPLKVAGFQQFVTTKGGAYCFLPSITALKYIADL